MDSFAIAGKDRVWHWAKAEIESDSIILSASNVQKPLAVRYAWAMNPSKRNLLYNKEGFPASPFRTDDWPLFDPNGEVIEVTKPKKKVIKKKTGSDLK
jgi:sialate O-acetylesterase